MIAPDSTLLHECLSGDRRAWEILIQRYSRLIFSIVLRSGLSEDDAADIFQSVCVKLLANLEKLKDDQHLLGWMILTAKRECGQLHRQRQRLHSLDAGESSADLLASDTPLPAEVVLQLEEEHLVR